MVDCPVELIGVGARRNVQRGLRLLIHIQARTSAVTHPLRALLPTDGYSQPQAQRRASSEKLFPLLWREDQISACSESLLFRSSRPHE